MLLCAQCVIHLFVTEKYDGVDVRQSPFLKAAKKMNNVPKVHIEPGVQIDALC